MSLLPMRRSRPRTAKFEHRVMAPAAAAGLITIGLSSAALSLIGCTAPRQQRFASPDEGPALSVEATDTLPVRHLTIGFSAGYLSDISQFQPALRRIAQDGFKYVRTLDPFTRADTANFKSLLSNLEVITGHGLIPYMSLSNFPYQFMPGLQARSTAPTPLAQERVARVSGYSNRYPPTDPARYQATLTRLLTALRSTFGDTALRRWYFEIGNEPDAPLYFFGTPEQFDTIYTAATTAFQDFDSLLVVGGAGFTATLVAGTTKPEFRALAQRIYQSPLTDFASFHIYLNKLPAREPLTTLIDKFAQTSKPKVISEWNIATGTNPRVERVLDSREITRYLIPAVAACYQTGVRMLLVQKLMDRPRDRGVSLGLFDKQGNPKGGYKYVHLMRRIVQEGYTVESSDRRIVIHGKTLSAAMSLTADNQLDLSRHQVLESSVPLGPGAAVLPAGEWVIFR